MTYISKMETSYEPESCIFQHFFSQIEELFINSVIHLDWFIKWMHDWSFLNWIMCSNEVDETVLYWNMSPIQSDEERGDELIDESLDEKNVDSYL